jgi:SulP family sulfate permease
VLAVVSWNMAERHQMLVLIRASRGEALVLLSTFLLTIFRDLTTGILVGFGIGALLFLHRMAGSVEVETGTPLIAGDKADGTDGDPPTPYDAALATDPDIAIYRISGAFFFGAAAAVATSLEQAGVRPRTYIIDFAAVPVLDSTAAATIEGFARKAVRQGARVMLSGARPAIRRTLLVQGVRPPLVKYKATLADALLAAKAQAPAGAASAAIAID